MTPSLSRSAACHRASDPYLWAKNKTWFHRDNQAAGMFTRRVREEAKPRRYRLSPDQVRVIDGLARAATLTANAPSTPAAVPIALGDGGRCGGQNSSSSSMDSVRVVGARQRRRGRAAHTGCDS